MANRAKIDALVAAMRRAFDPEHAICGANARLEDRRIADALEALLDEAAAAGASGAWKLIPAPAAPPWNPDPGFGVPVLPDGALDPLMCVCGHPKGVHRKACHGGAFNVVGCPCTRYINQPWAKSMIVTSKLSNSMPTAPLPKMIGSDHLWQILADGRMYCLDGEIRTNTPDTPETS